MLSICEQVLLRTASAEGRLFPVADAQVDLSSFLDGRWWTSCQRRWVIARQPLELLLSSNISEFDCVTHTYCWTDRIVDCGCAFESVGDACSGMSELL